MSERNGTLRPGGNSSVNTIVFGESGVGKTSLINLIAGRSVAATSNAAIGCTSEHQRYEFEVNETRYVFWDTAGLGEGTCGTVPAKKAEAKLRRLLTKENGVHLLIYCVRASRAKKALLHNYNLFSSTICRKKIPIVLVATGLEEHTGEMEEWWTANEAEFRRLGMHFDGHACVTTVVPQSDDSLTVKQRSAESRQAILSIIASTCSRGNSTAEKQSWKSATFNAVRAIIRPTNSQPIPIISMYELPEGTLEPIGSSKDRSQFESHLVDVAGDPLVVYHICDRQLLSGARFDKQNLSRSADLLIFCASIRADREECRQRVSAFHGSYGGATMLLLIIVRDATTDDEAREWWNKSIDPSGKVEAIVCALPRAESAELEAAVEKIQKTIQTHGLQSGEGAPGGCFAWLRGMKRRAKLPSGHLSARAQDDALTRAKVWVLRNSV